MTTEYENEDIEQQYDEDPLEEEMEQAEQRVEEAPKPKMTQKQKEARLKNLQKGRKKRQENVVRKKLQAEQENQYPAYEEEESEPDEEEEIILTRRPKKKEVQKGKTVTTKYSGSDTDRRLERIERMISLQMRREKYAPKKKTTVVNVLPQQAKAEPKMTAEKKRDLNTIINL